MQDFFHEKTVKELAKECRTVEDVQEMMKRLFKDTIQQVFEAELEEELGYQKHSTTVNNTLAIAETGTVRRRSNLNMEILN